MTARIKAGRNIADNTPAQHVERVAQIHAAKEAKAKAAKATVGLDKVLDKPAVNPIARAAAEASDTEGAGANNERTASAFDRLNEAYQDVMSSFALPTWKRTLVASVLSIAAACGSGYVLGQITGMLMVGVLTVTGSSFLAWIVFVLGCLAAAYAGMKIAGKVANYVMTEQIDRDIAAARDSVLGASRRVAGWLGLGHNDLQHA